MIKLLKRIFKRRKSIAKADGKDWDMSVIRSWGEELRARKADEMIFWR